ncbi:BZ3500_MvSof-1268-A1-R1_Chr1-3g02520 [Microbotryum saponariae]|uniref:Saccharopine dehydrogenase [NADP(+), L-glutamate-forming] n=1 Tax=Microbotryum saponariae TaxID=289078 RepID=A0A2X0KVP1_9BASI|nr:BZ3500_MvSof-1268-A1-R1_Chr1-3g02520 [Microbotryum saponariae]SCZ96468.1 BZ3501_MvSof-1269-A2-R1_Chr1-3g02123 [Microbotryum saponariae]
MSAELSHKTIVDGWFREISDEQWPGQFLATDLLPIAMTLRVKKILHVEQSLYQDVLVFESTDHGNVLVLDGAIQCVERDEFSYQEMIAHLPLASHPNPQNVLVIGGGDGGVLREVLKHPSVTSATLCDIDEAVPRVSREYLPHMAAGFNDPRVTVHIGDGFKWLDTHKGEFDVIITDSSDPVGPANSLFQKPYFQLLKEALKPGGSISTQGECIWLHLPLIDNLMTMTRTLFPVAEFAYTSIPTYPSGTIGFVVCTLDENRDLRTPLRDIENTRYWSKAVHKQAFTLPTFAQKVADKSKTKKAVTAGSSSAKSSSPKKVLLLGSGFVAAPAAEYILRRPENSLTIACRNVETAKALASELSREAQAISVDVADEASLDAAVKEHDLVISLIPYTYHTAVVKSAIKFKKNVVTTSYVSDAMKALEAEAIEAGIVVMNEIGVDPGVDHVWAIDMFDRVKQEGGKIKSFISYCGGLPAPESADNPLGYKFSWSSRGVLLALLNSARLYSKGELVEVDGKELMKHAQPYFISPAFAFVAYPNRDSTSFREKYDIPDAETVIRGTLRYQGFPAFIKALVDIKFLDESPVEYLAKGSTPLAWNEVTAKALGTSDKSEKALVEKIKSLTTFPTQAEEERIVSGLKWIGLFGEEKVTPRGNLLDTLCATLEAKMQYQKGERDMVMLQHKFEIENKDGSRETRTSTLLDFGAPVGSGGYSSMAKLVGVPCGVATQLVLDGVINKPGILAPYTRDIVDPLLVELRKEGIDMVEKTL